MKKKFFLFLIFCGLFISETTNATSLLLDASAGDNNSVNFGDVIYYGQTFYLTNYDYKISHIDVKLFEQGDVDGHNPLKLRIYNQIDDLPTGDPLVTCEKNYNYTSDFTNNLSGRYETFLCPVPFVTLLKDTTYVFTIFYNDLNTTRSLFFRLAYANSPFETRLIQTQNNGSSWTSHIFDFEGYPDTSIIYQIYGDIIPNETNTITIQSPTENADIITGNVFYNVEMQNDSGYDNLQLAWENLTTLETTFNYIDIPTGQFPQKMGYSFLINGEYDLTACMTKTGFDNVCSTIRHFNVITGTGGIGQYETPPPELVPFTFDYGDYSPFETPSGTFTYLTTAYANLLDPLNTWVNYFSLKFNFSDLTAQTETIKDNIKLFRSYIGTLDEFFGGVPISLFLSLFILIIIGKTIFMLSYRIITIIKP